MHGVLYFQLGGKYEKHHGLFEHGGNLRNVQRSFSAQLYVESRWKGVGKYELKKQKSKKKGRINPLNCTYKSAN